MKTWMLAAGLALFSSTAFSCTDFSGEYQTEEMTYYSIEQNGCESMVVADESGAHEMILDNQERLYDSYDIYIEDNVLLGHVDIYLQSKLEGKKYIYTEKDVVTYKDGTKDVETKWAEVSFNKDTDLETILHNADGSIETFVDIRNK